MKLSDKKENKTMKFVEVALLLASAVLFVFAILKVKSQESPMLDTYLGWTYILLGIALIFTIGFPLIRAFKDGKSLLKLLLIILGVVVICGGAYLLASGKPVETNVADVTEGTFKFADATLYVCYLLVVGAFVSLIWGGLRNSLKK